MWLSFARMAQWFTESLTYKDFGKKDSFLLFQRVQALMSHSNPPISLLDKFDLLRRMLKFLAYGV